MADSVTGTRGGETGPGDKPLRSHNETTTGGLGARGPASGADGPLASSPFVTSSGKLTAAAAVASMLASHLPTVPAAAVTMAPSRGEGWSPCNSPTRCTGG